MFLKTKQTSEPPDYTKKTGQSSSPLDGPLTSSLSLS